MVLHPLQLIVWPLYISAVEQKFKGGKSDVEIPLPRLRQLWGLRQIAENGFIHLVLTVLTIVLVLIGGLRFNFSWVAWTIMFLPLVIYVSLGVMAWKKINTIKRLLI